MISFIIPAYKAKWLEEAIKSILSQTYEVFELIIVNDKSPEDIASIVQKFDDSRIIYYINEKNIGGKNLLNQWTHCLSFAKGEYVVIAADDDIYDRHFAEECVKLANKYPESDIIRARTGIIDENAKLIGVDIFFPEYMSQMEYTYNYRIGSTFICMGNFMFKTSILKEKGFIEFPMALGSDIATSVEMAKNGIISTSDILFYFRQSNIHISGSIDKPKLRIQAITQLFEWLIGYPYSKPTNNLEEFYFNNLNIENWIEKRNYDYYNQIIKKIGFSHYFNSTLKGIPLRLKIKYFLKSIKDKTIF